MKRVLIISPNFPPVNGADMHRIRMSLPYFIQFGWEVTVLAVHEDHNFMVRDELLTESIPPGIQVIRAGAFKPYLVNGIAYRALWQLYREGCKALKERNYDLVYFSTTMFPVPVLGRIWKKKFKVPYVIDMQDPWRSDYYTDKPVSHQPNKYWLARHVHRYAEAYAMKKVDGLISVSASYIGQLISRYPRLNHIPHAIITFSTSFYDLDIAKKNQHKIPLLYDRGNKPYKNLVYVGRGGLDMRSALSQLFAAFKTGLEKDYNLFSLFRMHFIGTDYAPADKSKETVLPVAIEQGVGTYVTEHTGRIPYYSALTHLAQADGLIVPGSDDPGYTASKIYPYLMLEKPLFGIFHAQSPVIDILNRYRRDSVSRIGENIEITTTILTTFLTRVLRVQAEKNTDELWEASAMTKQQVNLFNKVIREQH